MKAVRRTTDQRCRKSGFRFSVKGSHPFFLIVRGEHRLEHPALESDAFGKACLLCPIDGFLDHHDGRQRHGAYFVCQLVGFRQELGHRHDPGHEPSPLGFLGIHHATGKAHVHGFRLANRAGQALRASYSRHDAEGYLRQPELRGFGCEG